MSIYLSRIAIENFRTFGKFDISVPAAPGLILLTGTNGLGKSSFFDAIEWALTGSIRRFTPYLKVGRKQLVEGDYLSRRGAPLNSHRVELGFSDGDTIERGGGKTTPEAHIIEKLSLPDRPAIKDLSTYLALTHFLGQAAQQRFTSREPNDQWEALKGPSGVERLENIRAGLRGRATVAAFRRRIESEQEVIATIEREIRDWGELIDRLQRLREVARASGTLTGEEIAQRIAAIAGALSALVPQTAEPTLIDSSTARLAHLRTQIEVAESEIKRRTDALSEMTEAPAQFRSAADAADTNNPQLVRAREALAAAQQEVARLAPLVQAAREATTAASTRIVAHEQRIALLEGVNADINAIRQLTSQLGISNNELTALARTIAEHRAEIEKANADIQAHGLAAENEARARASLQQAVSHVEARAKVEEMEGAALKAESALSLARDHASNAASELGPLEKELAGVKRQIEEAVQARSEAARHASAISAAVSQITHHLHDDETDCPVCQSSFPPGVLKTLAAAAAESGDRELSLADDRIETLRRAEQGLLPRIATLKDAVDAVTTVETEATAARAGATNAAAALRQALGAAVGDDLAAAVSRREADARAKHRETEATLAALAPSAAGATERRIGLSSEVDAQAERHRLATGRRDELTQQIAASASRITAQQMDGVTSDEIEGEIASLRLIIETTRSGLSTSVQNSARVEAEAAVARDALDQAERVATDAESARVEAVRRADKLEEAWREAGFAGSPSQELLDSQRDQIEADRRIVEDLSQQQLALAKENEEGLVLTEIEQVTQQMQSLAGEESASDPAAHLASLQERVAAARATLKTTTTARTAVNRYTETLKRRAEDFSDRVLDPLNVVINDFNEAMLSAPGESIQFRANTRVDATTFGMALRYREEIEQAMEAPKELPPQVVLSEGQLAANGFSILCAASTAYPWSRWRALLLDDPLQHNDIIHTAAFVDVMRNMVEMDGYQLVMSSHDRGESEFIARKFQAAGLPCTTVVLTAPSENGVVWEQEMSQHGMPAPSNIPQGQDSKSA